MLTQFSARNFRCLRRVNVPLKPLTVLIGPNDSGKSSFLRAIQTAVVGTRVQTTDCWRQDPGNKPVLGCGTENGGFAFENGGHSGNIALVQNLSPIESYRLPSTGPALVGPGANDTGAPPQLDENGTQVAALLDHVLRRDRRRFDDIARALRERVPGLDDVNVGMPKPDQRRVELRIEGGLLVDPDNMSTGVRVIVFFLALAYHPKPPKIMLIEEPENGLHPSRLKDVMDLLRGITLGEHCGHATQVIMTTHSPLLLDYVDLSTDQVLVFRRETDGSRTAEPVDRERLKIFLDEFMLGEVWLNQEEAGLVARKA